MKNNTFRYHKSPVVADKNNTLINGSHRLASAIALDNRRVNVVRSGSLSKNSFDYRFFGLVNGGAKNKLNEKYLDAMTVEYVSQKHKNIYAVVIFPSAHGHRKEVHEHLSKMGHIVNDKSIPKKDLSGVSVIRQLYYGEKWNNSYQGAAHKAEPCFKGDEPLHVYILETSLGEQERRKEKEYLRSIWNVDKHSIHITDTLEETNRVARMFFHEGSRNFLKLDQRTFMSDKIQRSFDTLLKVLPKNPVERDNICVEGSAVLDLLGIRDAGDIDYITRSIDFSYKDDLIECHNAYNKKFSNQVHKYSNDTIITDPVNHFYFVGVKFLDVRLLRYYKNQRKEGKDKKDITLIDDWISNGRLYEKAK